MNRHYRRRGAGKTRQPQKRTFDEHLRRVRHELKSYGYTIQTVPLTAPNGVLFDALVIVPLSAANHAS